MSADFFKKKRVVFSIIACILIAVFIFCITLFPFLRTKKIYIGHWFHYLVVNTENVEVGVFNAQLDGGAGYLLDVNNTECVALSVYTNEKDAHNVCAALQSVGEKCVLVTLGVDSLFLKTKEQKRNEREILGSFRTFYACLSVLEREIFRLDKGATQESSKRILSQLKAQFTFLGKSYSSIFSTYAKLCNKTAKRISELLSSEIYVKDLRNILCEVSYEYVCLGKEFS